MASSAQGKKKKKVLSQLQIEKLLGMLKEEDKPLRAGILAKTLGYQSAKDINPTLLRLEGYGTVCRVTMNNTALWKYSGQDNVSSAAAMALPDTASMAAEQPITDIGVVVLPNGYPKQENGAPATSSVEVHEASPRPSRPQSTKVDLEWDPTDIQVHRDEEETLMDNHITVSASPTTPPVNHRLYRPILPYAEPSHNKDKYPTNTSQIPVNGGTTVTPNVTSYVNGASMVLTSSNTRYASNQVIYSGRGNNANSYTISDIVVSGIGGGDDTDTSYHSQGNISPSLHSFDMRGDDRDGRDVHPSRRHHGGGAGDYDRASNGLGDNFEMGYYEGHNSDYNQDVSNELYTSDTSGSHSGSMERNTFSAQPNVRNYNSSPSYSGYTNFNSSEVSPRPSPSPVQSHSRVKYSSSHYPRNSGSARNSQTLPATYVVQEIVKADISSGGNYGYSGANIPVPPHTNTHSHHSPQDARTFMGIQNLQQNNQHFDNGLVTYTQNNVLHENPHQHQNHMNFHHHMNHHQHHHMNYHQNHMSHHHQHNLNIPHQNHHVHGYQSPLTQAANFVNMATFGALNHYQNSLCLGPNSSSRTYANQNLQLQGGGSYPKSGTSMKDYTAYRNSQGRRGHNYPGHTGPRRPATSYHSEMSTDSSHQGQHNLARRSLATSFTGPPSQDKQPDKVFNHHHNDPRFYSSGSDPTFKHLNRFHYGERRRRQSSNSSERNQSNDCKSKGTEELEDICRRIAKQASLKEKEKASCSNNIETAIESKATSSTCEPNIANIDEVPGKNSEKINNVVKAQEASKHNLKNSEDVKKSDKKMESKSSSSVNQRILFHNKPYQTRNTDREMSRQEKPKPSPMNGGVKLGLKKIENSSIPPADETNKINHEKGKETKVEKNSTGGIEKEESSTDQCDKPKASYLPLCRYKALLTDYLEPSNVLLSNLFVKGLIGQVFIEHVRRVRTRREAVERLLPKLLSFSPEVVVGGFCDALLKTGQGHLSDLIKCSGLDKDAAMSAKHVRLLEQHKQNIAAGMIPDKDLLSHLRTESVLTNDLYRFVSGQPTRALQIDALQFVLPLRGSKAFEAFRTALRNSGQPWLAEQIAMDLS